MAALGAARYASLFSSAASTEVAWFSSANARDGAIVRLRTGTGSSLERPSLPSCSWDKVLPTCPAEHSEPQRRSRCWLRLPQIESRMTRGRSLPAPSSGAETRQRAFLYLVKEDVAFVDYGFPGRLQRALIAACIPVGDRNR